VHLACHSLALRTGPMQSMQYDNRLTHRNAGRKVCLALREDLNILTCVRLLIRGLSSGLRTERIS
jgi:hypothetical protein